MAGVAPTYTYPNPTVDVDRETMLIIGNRRPDIIQTYCGQNRPDGTPWCPNGVPVIKDIITDWWLHTAGENDAPSIYDNSLAKWVAANLGIPIKVQPGAGTVSIQSYDVGSSDGTITSKTFVGMGVVVLVALMFLGRRDKVLSYQPDPRLRGAGGINRAYGLV